MSRLLVMLTLVLSCGCSPTASAPKPPEIELWNTGSADACQRTHERVLQNYGSHVLLVKGGPVKLRMYMIQNGSKKQVASLVVDPAIHPLTAITPALRTKEAAIEISAPRVIRTSGGYNQTLDFDEVTFPVPHQFGCNRASMTSKPTEEVELLHYWIAHSAEAEVMVADSLSEDAMQKRSAQGDVSYVLITVAP